MKIVITGGSGMIGKTLAIRLAASGHQVIILSRSPERVRDLPIGVKAVAWDARSAARWAPHADGADVIVNLAGASIKGEGFLPSRWSSKRKELIRQSRIDVGSAVVDAVRQAHHKPKLVLQASAVGYYGPRDAEIVTEDSAPGSDFLAEVCKAWEASTSEVENMGVRRVITRTGLVLTMQGGAFPLLVLPFRLFGGGWFGSGRQYYPWIHFEDYLAALQFLIEGKSATGVYNLTAPQPVTNREFARALGRATRRPAWLPAPAFAMRLALGEVSTVVLEGQRAVPAHLQADGFKFQHTKLEPALRDLLK